jgi:hypothetical protein
MHEVSAHARVQTAVRCQHVGGAETVNGKCLERTGRLIPEHRDTAAHRHVDLDGGRDAIFEDLQSRRVRVHVERIARHGAHRKRIRVGHR